MSKNERFVDGKTQIRLFAYLHKTDRSRFGLLNASDSADARRHLGSGYRIRQTWLTLDEFHDQMHDRERKWSIVAMIFLNPASSAYVG